MTEKLRVLSIEDDLLYQRNIAQTLGAVHLLQTVHTLSEAREKLLQQSFDVILLDRELPDGQGTQAIAEIKELQPHAGILMLTNDDHWSSVLESLDQGASDYVVKSGLTSMSELLFRVPMVRNRISIEKRNELLEERLKLNESVEMIGRSQATRDLLRDIRAIKGVKSSVLVTGESGTGKEVIARLLNQQDGGPKRPLVTVNCGALPAELVESELFGHKRGAFTGAIADKKGAFERAHGGDLFLDEIGDLPLPVQVKLLRAIEYGSFCPVGGKEQTVSVRVICATHQDLEEMITKKTFREDLYYRINVIRLHTLPLRRRADDIYDLAHFFLLQLAGPAFKFEEGVIDELVRYEWPGNIRELRNWIERAVIEARKHSRQTISLKGLNSAPGFKGSTSRGNQGKLRLPKDLSDVTPESYEECLREAERQYLASALAHCGEKAPALAERLQIAKSTVYEKLKNLELTADSEKGRPGLKLRPWARSAAVTNKTVEGGNTP